MKLASSTTPRVESIDILRGIVMIIMALDHVRGYMHVESLVFDPTDLHNTTGALFATRLITHLCAPTFIFLAGTSVYFMMQRKTRKETSFFLRTRGAWLILLQITLIRFGWNFDPAFHYNSSNIISTIGFCMIALSVLICLDFRIILFIGLAMVAGHNTLDHVSFANGSLPDVVWSFLHVHKAYALGHDYSFLFLYPLIPWVGVMALGYCLGRLYDHDIPSEKRKIILMQMGLACLGLFFLLRFINVYGDPQPWSFQTESSKTIMSFFSLEKYPPSLLYLCLTLGVSLILLNRLESSSTALYAPVALFGKVALFYYVLHIFVVHSIALIAATLSGYPWQTMIFIGGVGQPSPLLRGRFGFNLSQIYALWIGVIIFLYPFCVRWNSFKIRNRSRWWTSYV